MDFALRSYIPATFPIKNQRQQCEWFDKQLPAQRQKLCNQYFAVLHSHCPFVATATSYLQATNSVKYLVVETHLCRSLATRKCSFRIVTMFCTGELNQQESSVQTTMPYKGALCLLLLHRLVCVALLHGDSVVPRRQLLRVNAANIDRFHIIGII